MYLLYTYIYISVHCQSWPRSMLQQMPQLPARGCSWNNSADQNFATIFASQRPPIWTWTCLEFLFRSSSRWTLHSTLELVILPREHWFRNTETAMGNQRPIGKFLRCKSNEVLKLCGASAKEQMVVEMTLTWKNPCKAHEMNQWIKDSTNQWIRDQWINKSMKQWITETMNQWLNNSMKQQVNESTAQRLNESVKQRISESMNQWLNDPMSQSINESANQWSTANHWIKEPISQWVHDSNIQWTNESSMIQCFHESVHQWINEPWVNGSAIQWVNESVSQRINESMGEWMSEWSERMNEWMKEWKNEGRKERRKEWMNEWVNEPLNQWTTEPMNPCINWFCQPHPPKVLRSLQVFAILNWLLSRADFACFIFQKWPDPLSFCDFEMQSKFIEMQIELSRRSRAHFANFIFQKRTWFFELQIELSLQSRAHFENLIFQKSSKPVIFFAFWSTRELSLQSCAFLSLFVNEPRNCGKQRPSFGDHGSHFTRKNAGFRARQCFHPWIHMRPNRYTSQLLDDGWLTWWCGWPDGGNANHDNRP